MKSNVYNVGDLKRLIAESSNEFKPVLGKNVESENKSNNGKAYKDAEKLTDDFDGGLDKLPKKEDFNATTLDYNPRVEPSKEWKDRVKAQAEGYTSVAEKNNGIDKSGNANFEKNKKIYNQFKDANEERQGERERLSKNGLTSHVDDENGYIKQKPTMTESVTPKPKRLVFKHRRFMNESEMLHLIPEEYKKDGQKIYMQDAHDNEYIVECVQSKTSGTIETQVTSFKNKEMINEQMNRIQELFNYNRKTTSGRNTIAAQKV